MSVKCTRGCNCGAVTVFFDNGANNSMSREKFDEIFPGQRIDDAAFYNCNHCVNHWGIDLCGCGSGEPVGECDGGFAECKAGTPAQYLEQARPAFAGWR